MRRLLTIVCAAVLLCAGATTYSLADTTVKLSDAQSGMYMLDQSQQGVTLQVQVGQIDFMTINTKEGLFVQPVVGGFTHGNNIGEPRLPVTNRLLSIPFDCELSVRVLDYEVQEIDLKAEGIEYLLMPTQPSLSKSEDADNVPFEFNRAAYLQRGYYALDQATAKILGTMRSVNIGRVSVAPVEYDPVDNKLRVYTNMTIQVDYQGGDWAKTEAMHREYYSPFFEPALTRVVNYPTLAQENKNDLTQYPVTYVIVSDPMFEAQLQPFIEWKVRKGFHVIEAYTDVIGTSNTAIKAYLQDLYENPAVGVMPPSFVLLVGDDQQIQAFSGSAGSHITDKKFVEYTGDLFPEVYIGRFAAQTTDLLQPQIDKTLEYETYAMPDPSYLEKVNLIAGVDGTWAITHGNGQINYGTTYYFNLAHGIDPNVWLYPASDAAGASDEIIDEVNNGVGFMNYTAHCGHSSQSDPSFTVTDINNLTNIHKYLLGIGNCCLANTFGDDYSSPCFGEAFVQAEDKGGIGYIGGTNSTYWDEDYWWGVGYGPVVGAGPTYEETGLGAYDGIFHDHGEPTTQHYIANSAIFFAGNMAVTESGSSREAYYWEIYSLMGDPSVMTYMGIPATNPVMHAGNILLTATQYTVQADPGSYVGLSKDGVLHGAGYVDASGSVTIDIVPFGAPGEAEIVVTGQNRIPYVEPLMVIAPNGPYVVYDTHDINDASGNMDGLLDAGETVTMGMQLKNVGPDDAINVTAVLSTDDPLVTITDDNDSFGTVLGNDGTSYVADAFGFKVASTTEDGHWVTFNLTVDGTGRETWEGSFTVQVHAPVLSYLDVDINDISGNNNGILDPGETAEVVVSLENSGSAIAYGTSALLSETDTYVSISDDYGAFGDIAAEGGVGENTTDVFEISADQACPMGHTMTFDLTLTTTSGYETTAQFGIVVGDREPIFTDDFSFDQGWTGLGGSAEWTIGACTGGSGDDGSGGPDPSDDHSPSADNQVLGNDLTPGTGGDYNDGISSTQWVYSPMIDCSDYDGVELYFFRWLGVESSSYDHAYFEVYDGSTWHRLYENGSSFDDGQWTEQYYDVGTYADENPNFQIRFGMGSTDGSVAYCGWNVDDILLKGYNQATGTPQASIDMSDHADTLHQGESCVDTVMIQNDGDGKLKLTFTSTETWMTHNLQMVQVLPYQSMAFEVTVSTTGMACGEYTGTLSFETNDPLMPSGDIAFSLSIPSPEIAMDVVEIDESVAPGEAVDVPITLSNTGPGRLSWQLSCTMFSGKDVVPTSVAAEVEDFAAIGSHPGNDKDTDAEPFFAPNTKGSGGPDNYGYRWADSDEPGGPAFGWVDISGVGTLVEGLGDDNNAGPFPIGFGFPFYDNVYTELYVGSNGIVTFGSGSGSYGNGQLPNAAEPNDLIALWWDDLDPEHSGSVYYYYDDTQGRFIVSFNGVPNYQSPTGTGELWFQVILYTDGKILLQYDTMDHGGDDAGFESATIGIENAAGDDGLTVAYNQAYLQEKMAILISSWRWLSATPMIGTIEPGEDATVTVSLNSTDLGDGVFTGQLDFACNDPINPSMSVPVTFSINSYICGDIDGSGGTMNIADITYIVGYMFNEGPEPPVMDAADIDGDPGINIADVTYAVGYLFNEGPEPNCP